ncbi:expressed unknown protein [Ectocarpus siliculosus]|uniref:Uncharacterized protein n=1 Tax=Ectocarpus siliculosus TaxID=2880 RepID=D7G8X3_ECTSI|nr:expressed unknown protein [Ectocarpus siliculosus]|eukprot:CBJ28141.1 expressed unknown protein [Ectocarpus siliculosus]
MHLGPEDLAIAAPAAFFPLFGDLNNPSASMDAVDPIFALAAVNPLLAAVVLPVYFALSVWSTHRVVYFLLTWSATQTAKRCDRWAQECEATPASSWWQRRVVPFIFPSQKHRSRFCRDVEKFEACPKYVQELRLIATPATAGGDATPTPARAFSSITNEHHNGKGDSHRCSVFLGTIRKGTARAWREIRAAAKRVGAVAKCAWSETREKVYFAVLKKTGIERKVGGSSCSVVGGHSPAQPRKAPSDEDRVLAAQRTLRGSDTTSAVRLAFGLNTPLQSRDSVASPSWRLRAREPCLAWRDWDDLSLKVFLAEEARTSRHPVKWRRQVEEFYHRAALPTLARQWNVPFLSKGNFCGRRRQPRISTTSSATTAASSRGGSDLPPYSHFLQLWEDVCETHDGVRDFAFPPKGAVSSARGAFSEVLGEKRPEEQRRETFCELLGVLMKLEPRPPALRHFLAPWPTESTASSSTAATRLVGGRRNREGQHQQEQARGEDEASWAGTRTTRNGGGDGGGSESASFGGTWLNGGGSDARREDQRQQRLRGVAAGGLPVTLDRPPHNDRSRGSTTTIRQVGVAAATAEGQSAVPLPRNFRLWAFLTLLGVLEACAALRALGVTALSLPVTLVLTAIAPAVAAVVFSVSSHPRSWPSPWPRQRDRRPPQVDADSGDDRRRATAVPFGRRPWEPNLLGGVAAAAAAAVGLGGLCGSGGGGGGGAAAVGLGGVGAAAAGAAADVGLGGVGGGSGARAGAPAATAAVGLGGRGGTRRRSGGAASSGSPTRGRVPRRARRRSPARPPMGRRGRECVNDLGIGLSASSSPATAVGGVRAVAAGVPGGIAQELQME